MQMVDAQQRRFLFRETLGQGGFGEVYLAEMSVPSGLVSTVAVKVLHGGLDPASQAVRRLTDEGKILSMLNHPGIVAVHDLAIIEGRVALVTEFVEGADLPDCMVGDDPMPKGAIYEALAAVADALMAAHNATNSSGAPLGLLHRDVKPRNIRVGRHGQVKLLDFGIATGSGIARDAQTGTNALIGSFPYMAPERFKRSELGPASDYYSLGCALFEMLTGEKLFLQEDVAELIVPKTVPANNVEFLEERFSLLDERAPEAIPLLRSMTMMEASARPDGPTLLAALEDLAADVGGVRLARWARGHDWTATTGDVGTLTGKTIAESPVGVTTHQPGPPPVDATVEIELGTAAFAPTTNTTSSTTFKTGLGAAALLTTGGGLFVVVVLLTVGIGWYWSQWSGEPVEQLGNLTPVPVPNEPVPDPEPPAPALDASSGAPTATPPPGTVPSTDPTADGENTDGDNDNLVGDDRPQADHNDGQRNDGVADGLPPSASDTGAGCGEVASLERRASIGRLSNTDRSCLAREARRASLSQTSKIKAGRIVLVDAQARCKAGEGCADYEREQPWFFEDLNRSDPNMMLAWASHQLKRRNATDAMLWATRGLDEKDAWTGRTYLDNVDALWRIKAMAANERWTTDHRNEDKRNQVIEAAADWASFRSTADRPTAEPMALCRAAAGSADRCNSRVPDRAARVSIVFATKPAGASIAIDGKAAGVTPKPIELTFGTHEVVVSVEGKTSTKSITVGMGAPNHWMWTAENDGWESAF